jgi:hypothetical protein
MRLARVVSVAPSLVSPPVVPFPMAPPEVPAVESLEAAPGALAALPAELVEAPAPPSGGVVSVGAEAPVPVELRDFFVEEFAAASGLALRLREVPLAPKLTFVFRFPPEGLDLVEFFAMDIRGVKELKETAMKDEVRSKR